MVEGGIAAEDIAVHDILEKIEYGDGTMLEFFEISDDEIVRLGDNLSDIVSAVRRYKTENGYSQKEELETLEVLGYKGTEIFEGDIKAVGTIKNIIFTSSEEKEIKIQK